MDIFWGPGFGLPPSPSLQPSTSDALPLAAAPAGAWYPSSAGSRGPQSRQCAHPSTTLLHRPPCCSVELQILGTKHSRTSRRPKTHLRRVTPRRKEETPGPTGTSLSPGGPHHGPASQGPVHLTFSSGGREAGGHCRSRALEVHPQPSPCRLQLFTSSVGLSGEVRSNQALSVSSHLGDERNVM